jgi:hypothetical protein
MDAGAGLGNTHSKLAAVRLPVSDGADFRPPLACVELTSSIRPIGRIDDLSPRGAIAVQDGVKRSPSTKLGSGCSNTRSR